MPLQTLGSDGPRVSRLSLGCMGLTGTWNPAEIGEQHIKRAVAAFETALEIGVTLFDHADIYGGTSCESAFKQCLQAVPGSRERIIIATKCGIRTGFYNLSYDYILQAIRASLDRMGIEYVDLYQLHRPDPFTHPSETARALNQLVREGRVRCVGVSNYYPEQVRALQRWLDVPLRSNQFEVSLSHLPPIYDPEDGTIDQCELMGMTPLAYSPLGRGLLTGARQVTDNPVLEGLLKELTAIGEAHNASPTQMALAWLLAHPARIIPVFGSANPAHIREAAGAVSLSLTREEWYRLWVAGRGKRVP
jgi:predicted oxidoreductase